MADDPKDKGGEDTEAAWAALEERVKKSTRATLDEWWEERKAEAAKEPKEANSFFGGSLGSILFPQGRPASKASKD